MPRHIDLTGQKFGKLTAVSYSGRGRWVFECECGRTFETLSSSVKSGGTTSCGCKRRSVTVKNNLLGKRFGRLTVLELSEPRFSGNGRRINMWECQCDCGNKTIVSTSHLTSGHTFSCGCAHKEQMEKWKTVRKTHGKTKSKSYKTWLHIKARCYNPSNKMTYPYYGAKGIRMYEGWIDSPEEFCRYVEQLPRYLEADTTIDRIDFTKNYEPGNLRWITMDEQQRNKCSNVWITAFGKCQTISEWSRETGINASTLSARIRAGWDHCEAVSRKAMCGKKPSVPKQCSVQDRSVPLA